MISKGLCVFIGGFVTQLRISLRMDRVKSPCGRHSQPLGALCLSRRTFGCFGLTIYGEDAPFAGNPFKRTAPPVGKPQPRAGDKVLHGARHEDLARTG
jgi:hypothetical protein